MKLFIYSFDGRRKRYQRMLLSLFSCLRYNQKPFAHEIYFFDSEIPQSQPGKSPGRV